MSGFGARRQVARTLAYRAALVVVRAFSSTLPEIYLHQA
jgi:hypothetical protein